MKLLYSVWLAGSCIGAVYAEWPLPDNEVSPVQGDAYMTLVTRQVSEFEYQVQTYAK